MSILQFTPHPILEAPTDDEILLLSETPGGREDLLKWHQSYHTALRAAEEDPLNHGFELEGWKYADKFLQTVDTVILSGGNRCLAGDQEIYDPVTKKSRQVQDIDGDFHVWAYDTLTGQREVARALKPYQKQFERLYRIDLSNGQSFSCSAEHRFATPFGWRSLSESSIGQLVFSLPASKSSFVSRLRGRIASFLFRPQSNLGRALLACAQDVLYWKQTLQDCLGGCLACHRLYDEQPRLVLGVGPAYLPLRVDVPKCKEYAFDDLDDLAHTLPHNRSHLWFVLPSILCAPIRFVAHCGASLCRILMPAYSNPQSKIHDRSSWQCHLLRFVGFVLARCGRTALVCLSGFLTVVSWLLSKTGFVWLVKVNDKQSGVVWDFEVPEHFNYFIGDVPQKNSSKTEFGARSVVKAALENPGAEIVCFAQDADASIRIQQKAVYRYLPPKYKEKSKSTVEYLNYTHKNGFTGASFILPNGSTVYFHTYSQFQANRSKFEGLEIGSKNPKWHNIGMWADEYLDDGDLISTMRFRLATRDSKLLITATPIKGYTPFIGTYLKNAKTTQTRTAPLLNNEEVPFVQYSIEKDAGIVYFHSSMNPFGGYERIAKELKHSSREEILTRAYGIPVKSMTTLFPLFNTDVHVVSERPTFDRKKHTCYMVVDPAGNRNYTALWAIVDSQGNIDILREWPDRDTFGEWAIFGEPRWKKGPAADKLGYDVQGYVDLFTEIESELQVKVFERIGDSRYFASENDDNVDLFTQFAEKDMNFVPADGRHEEIGLTALDEWFKYNPNLPVDGANRPILRIHESCGNLIYSLINYGANGKQDEALKDFIDLMRYLRLANAGEGPEHYDESAFKQPQKMGGY